MKGTVPLFNGMDALHRLFFIIIVLVMISSTDRIKGEDSSTRKLKSYQFPLIHRDSVLPAYESQKPAFAVGGHIRTDNRNGIFMVNISIGVPQNSQLVAMDTASSLLWVECNPCTSCPAESTPRFNPLNSSTYKNISCTSSSCDYLQQNSHCDTQGQCAYALMYSEGTYTRGTLAYDTLTMKTSDFGTFAQDIVFGCSSYDKNVPQQLYPSSGVLGLDFGPLSLVRQLGIKRFSYCIGSLNDSQNHLVLGDKANLAGSLTPLELYHDRYYVQLQGISVADKNLEIDSYVFELTSEGGVMVDSGTPLSYLVAEAFKPLKEEIQRQVRKLFSDHRKINLHGESLCYRGNVIRDIHEFPVVTFHFARRANLELDIDSIFDQTTDEVYCMAFRQAERNDINVIGMKAQQYHNIGYDIDAFQLSVQRIGCGLLQD